MPAVDHYENFPVASWLCPPHLRGAVVALYHFARTADDLADEGEANPAERLQALARYRAALDRLVLWARRWCPWTARDGTDGLVLDTTGSDHLWGGEAAMLVEIETRLSLLGLSAGLAIAPTSRPPIAFGWPVSDSGPAPGWASRRRASRCALPFRACSPALHPGCRRMLPTSTRSRSSRRSRTCAGISTPMPAAGARRPSSRIPPTSNSA